MKHFLETKGFYSVHKKSGYRFNRPLFFAWAGTITLMITLAFSWYLQNGVLYVNCPIENERPCENPLYEQCDELRRSAKEYVYLCEQEFLNAGFTVGNKPPYIYNNLGFIFGVLLLLLLIVNHFAFNKNIKVVDL